MSLRLLAALSLAAALLAPAAFAQTPAEGVEVRKPWLRLVPESMVNQTAAQQYAQMKQQAQAKGRLNVDPAQTQRVRAIAARLIPQGERFHPGARDWRWEVNVVESPAVNAFVLPGGKIMVYSGLIERLKLTDDELAAIVGHEIAHALLEHGRARMSEALVKNVGISVAAAYLGLGDLGTAALAQAADLAITLPYSRSHETDADLVGIELAARAGYDPRAAISVWEKMARGGGAQPPELLSTHPANASRIRELEEAMPRVLPLYQAARR
ncbi:MAG: M48 family metallopeptidase [Betaproteobacteria bacterium]